MEQLSFPCSICHRYYQWPYEAVACEGSHGPKLKQPSRPELQVLRLLSLVDPNHADTAMQSAMEILEALSCKKP